MKVIDISKRGMTLVLTLIIILSSFSFVAAETFSDIPNNHWAKDNIEYLAQNNLVNGLGDGRYGPNNDITRAQFVRIINNALGLTDEPQVSEIDFKDVHVDAWYYEDVLKAVDKGYVTGHGDGTFTPNNPVTREQAATMIVRAFELGNSSNNTNFLDKDRISSWAREYVNVASDKGYIVGFPDGNFKPDSHITKAQSATIVYRLLTDDVEEVETKADQLIKEANKYLGNRYISGGASPNGFDCSGFTQYVYGQVGTSLPRTTTAQATVGSRVSKANLKPGDLLVFSNTYKAGVSHVGIYLGNGQFIHSANARVGVEINHINSGYWSNHFSYGRSIF